jgi:hypothetical protein
MASLILSHADLHVILSQLSGHLINAVHSHWKFIRLYKFNSIKCHVSFQTLNIIGM